MRLSSMVLLQAGWWLVATLNVGAADQKSFLGEWALYPPGGQAGWLGVYPGGDGLTAQIMWVSGSVLPLDTAKVEEGKLRLTRTKEIDGKVDGKPAKIKLTETIMATLEGSLLNCVSVTKPAGQGEDRIQFTGKRLPPMPPAPDLSKVKFGKSIQLFNGKDLQGWRLTATDAVNGWGVRDGILFNDPKQEEGRPKKSYGNLRTEAEFENFAIHAEARLDKDSNSGIYLRGIYEVQVYDSFGKPTDSHNLGAVYSRIKPTVAAEKPRGEWQTLDLTLVDRHVTVVLNGVTIIDNQPVPGPTGGALWSEVDRPGPVYLQGDHTGIEYRNLVLRPVLRR